MKVNDILSLLPLDCNVYILYAHGKDLERGTAGDLYDGKSRDLDVRLLAPYCIGGSKDTPVEKGIIINV